jgi:hypothetical protein
MARTTQYNKNNEVPLVVREETPRCPGGDPASVWIGFRPRIRQEVGAGKVSTKEAPAPGRDSTSMLPACSFMM